MTFSLDGVLADLDAYAARHPWRRRLRRVQFVVKHAPGNGHNCDADNAAIDAAQDSMRWVADHLPNLWD